MRFKGPARWIDCRFYRCYRADRLKIGWTAILTPSLPFEFVVPGLPASTQGSPRGISAWKSNVVAAARDVLPEGNWLLEQPLAVTIYVFLPGRLAGDLDNRVKPILDAMTGCVYLDDSQIERIVVQKFEPDRRFEFKRPSAALGSALQSADPIVYVAVSDDTQGDLR